MQDLAVAIEVENEPDERRRLSNELVALLLPHIQTEEEVLYAALKEVVDEWHDRSVLLEAHAAHEVILGLVEKMQHTPTDTEAFQGTVLLLDRLMTFHMEQEEDVMYDMANRYLSYEDFSALSKRMQAVQQRRLDDARRDADRSTEGPTMGAKDG